MADPYRRLPKSVDELRGDLSILKLRIALLEEQEDELIHIEKDYDTDEGLQKLIKAGEPKVLRHINRGYRKSRAKHFARKTIPRIANAAACLLLICYMGLTVAIAADSTVRIKIMNFIMNIEERYASFGFEDSGEFMDIPTEWEGYYYPSYIPEGMTLTNALPETVLYTHSDGRYLWFDDMCDGAQGTLDTENATLDFVTINGHMALISEKEQWVSLLWNIDNRIIMLSYTGERDEAIRIAESVRMIK